MRALSLARPWAHLVASGAKTVENRTWTAAYRGPLLVHASKRWDAASVAVHLDQHPVETRRALADAALDDRHAHAVGVLGVAQMTGVCGLSVRGEPCDCGPWAMDGLYHWQLADARPFPEPLDVQGQLGLWRPGQDVLGWVLTQAVAHSLGGPR